MESISTVRDYLAHINKTKKNCDFSWFSLPLNNMRNENSLLSKFNEFKEKNSPFVDIFDCFQVGEKKENQQSVKIMYDEYNYMLIERKRVYGRDLCFFYDLFTSNKIRFIPMLSVDKYENNGGDDFFGILFQGITKRKNWYDENQYVCEEMHIYIFDIPSYNFFNNPFTGSTEYIIVNGRVNIFDHNGFIYQEIDFVTRICVNHNKKDITWFPLSLNPPKDKNGKFLDRNLIYLYTSISAFIRDHIHHFLKVDENFVLP